MQKATAQGRLMSQISGHVQELEIKLIVSPHDAQNMHADFDCTQLSIFTKKKNNTNHAPTVRSFSLYKFIFMQ